MSPVASLADPAAPSRSRRLLLWLAAAFALLAAFSPRDLWAPDEPRYGLVARHMLEAHDYVVPRVNGMPYPEKPPVAFWAMAGAGAVMGGVSAVAARVGCALLAAAAVLTLARLARRWFDDPELGDTAGILFATTGLVLWNSSRAALDLPMTLFALLALEAGTAFVASRSAVAALGTGVALGLGVLVKGPHALYVPIGGIVGGCLASGKAKALRDPRWLLALAALGAVVAAWLYPAIRLAGDEATADGTKYGARLLGQIGSRLAGENEPHLHGFWFFVPLILVMGLPWSPAWVAGLVRAARPVRSPLEERFGLGAAGGALVLSLLLLSVPGSKRELYLIPPLATACVLGAYALRRLPRDPAVRTTPLLAGVVLAGVVPVLLAAPFVRFTGLVPAGPGREVADALGRAPLMLALLGAAALAGVAARATFKVRAEPERASVVGGIGLGLVWVVLAITVMPTIGAQKSFAPAAEVAARERPGAPLFGAGFTDPSVLWWFHRDRMTVLGNTGYAEAARALAADAPPAVVLVKGKFWDARKTAASPATLEALERAVVLWRDEVGGGEFLLLSNAPKP